MFGQWVRGQLILGFAVGIFTFIGLLILSQLVDPVFGRYAVLLSIIAGVLELVPIIGPIISAVPAVLLAADGRARRRVAALALYLLVQQVENNLLVPKIQGDAVELHPAIVMAAIIIGGSLAGLLGAILALPDHGGRARRRPLPLPADEPGRSGAAGRHDRPVGTLATGRSPDPSRHRPRAGPAGG